MFPVYNQMYTYNITVLKRIEKKIHSNTRFTRFPKIVHPI